VVDPLEADLSPAADLLLLAIDPDGGGLLPRKRRRFLRALALAKGAAPRGATLRGLRARRDAMAELAAAGLVGPDGRPVDRLASGKRMRRIRDGLAAESLTPRDDLLLVLLAYSGMLVSRLSRDERRLAHRRLRTFVQHPDRLRPTGDAADRVGGTLSDPGSAAAGAAVATATAAGIGLGLSHVLDNIDLGGDVSGGGPGDFGGGDFGGGGDSGGGGGDGGGGN
jgi:uncharacterized membrane protein YgcG